MILLTNQSPDLWHQASVYTAMLVAIVVSYLAMRVVNRVTTVIGAGGIQILARLMGLLLAALAIQFIVDGVKGFIK
jgi:multiple antibiotic resistance protein